MTNLYIKKVAQETGKSIEYLEENWDVANARAEEAHQRGNLTYIIFLFETLIDKNKTENV